MASRSGEIIIVAGPVVPASTASPAAAPPAPPNHFSSPDDLKNFARKFIGERVTALKKDVDHCLQKPYAPFPAIMFCFATVDMMGALVKGEAHSGSSTVSNTASYFKEYMGYTDEECFLMMNLFRHKLAHLSQPKIVVKYDPSGKFVTWHYHHDDVSMHRKIAPMPAGAAIEIKAGWTIPVDQTFHLGIKQLVKEIEDSVYGQGGYFDKFGNNTDSLQENFKKAVARIYSHML